MNLRKDHYRYPHTYRGRTSDVHSCPLAEDAAAVRHSVVGRRTRLELRLESKRIPVDASGYLSHVVRFACGEQASGFGPRSAKVQRTGRAKARSVAPSHSHFHVAQLPYGRS